MPGAAPARALQALTKALPERVSRWQQLVEETWLNLLMLTLDISPRILLSFPPLIVSTSSLQWFKGQPWPRPQGPGPLALGCPPRSA